MSSCITTSLAKWISDDPKSRKWLDDYVHSTIGSTEKNTNGLPNDVSKIVVDYLEDYPCFGESEWEALGVRVDFVPPLCDDFPAIWRGPCPIDPRKEVSETHRLVLMPATVDGGKPFTLNKLVQIANRYFPKNDEGYGFIHPDIVSWLGDKPIDRSRWVLVTKEILPRTMNQTYVTLQKTVARLAAKSSSSYKIPGILESSTSMLAQFCNLQTPLLSDRHQWTYTRCKEQTGNFQIVVGGFTRLGYPIIDCRYSFSNSTIGVLPIRTVSKDA